MALWPKKKNRKPERVCDPDADTFAVFDGVGVTLGQRTVLEDLTLSLKEARIGVIGLNGSGKSTFVRLLNGLRTPDKGNLTLFGAPAADAEPELPRHVGFVFQNPDHQAIFPTVEEEIAFGLTQLGAGKEESRKEARAFLELHGCLELAESPIAELSEGQKQLVCILSVLVMEPELLILDEPMTSLDALAVRRIYGKLMSLPQKIVMISHDLTHFENFDRVIWLEGGRVRLDGPPQQVLAAYRNDIEEKSGTKMELAAL
ncbi:MAG: ABC transporter ATP-binding protein [Roseibium sp.]|uniref:energy-coupling factor ABC transporter ATP-binding protein n=1 Tax=Roseibium sp. TaxID=1936156 RepID=UPI001B13F0A8|nr:ABC transporter ATP-binding protein [Roseibium sp.]MBO6895004.1 ABC transporter ATP-binding protein [Roseibium sp.]MBO6931259.1 ABC transporter ATP-binding protein [Roseibium sp.]